MKHTYHGLPNGVPSPLTLISKYVTLVNLSPLLSSHGTFITGSEAVTVYESSHWRHLPSLSSHPPSLIPALPSRLSASFLPSYFIYPLPLSLLSFSSVPPTTSPCTTLLY